MSRRPVAVPAASGARRRRGWLLKAAFWSTAIGATALLSIAAFVDQYGQVDRAQPADAIVVLGAHVLKSGMPGESLRARTLHAVGLYRQGLAPKIICTGGVGDNPPSEAQSAATLAMRHGVPAADLVLEDRSTSTSENTANAAALCRPRGWTRVIAVSDPYHVWRACRDFRRAGLEAAPSPALNWSGNQDPAWRFRMALREAVLIVRDFLLP